MRLGNDIVDRAATREHNPRFVDRILNPEEKSRHQTWSLDEPLLWLYWACKEAAYKAIRQSRDIPFHHREFIVSPDMTTLRYHTETLRLSTRQEGDALFALATDADPVRCHSRILSFDTESDPATQSAKARSLLLELTATTLQCPVTDLAITSTHRIPKILQKGRVLPHPVSLTHHGRYVAASLAIS
ncbi:4'-phosphopantetheinyl transferase superfamily protein [Oligoflexus tunisiensis]|uniref:4'-phosphopantetheinyl transferase superfamily protein n=1 Tax=Oligoflexus tunisiensis TaxID=708132 RepID=UPI000AE58491|nr:4'-phosphopantetheinyl transferase superfamily protein [Oligoflexus tunisiensis]